MAKTVRQSQNQLRIIAGHLRGRLIRFPSVEGLRPTPDRARETLFNWLRSDIPGARCLDLFAGSGILGFEAVSRGAKSVVCVERDKLAVRAMVKNAREIGAGNIEMILADVLAYLARRPSAPNDIVFMDPPFDSNLLEKACELLERGTWLADQAVVYIERRATARVVRVPANWVRFRCTRMGQVECGLYRRVSGAKDRD